MHRSCVRSGKWSGQWGWGGWGSHLDFLPNNTHFIDNIKTQAYRLHVLVFSELCEMANKIGNTKRLCGGELV